MTTVEFPDETLTRSLVRYLEVPGVDAEFALITLDNGLGHTRPATFGPAGLAELDAALDSIEARQPPVAAIAVTGAPFVFAVGADLSGVPLIRDRDTALEIGRLGHRVFRRLSESAVPTFAFVNGATMGGGLELALHCRYRTLSSAAAPIAAPECALGLVPGWGGTQLLTNLVGADRAVTLICEYPLANNRTLRAGEAYRMGLADVLLEPADFLEESLRWAGRVLAGEVTVERPEPDRGEAWTEAVRRGRDLVEAKVHGAAPAPYRALELVELARTADADTGYAAEDEALADMLMTDQMRASVYAFNLARRANPSGAPDPGLARPVTKVGVIGAGLMASQLAVLFARRLRVPVVLTDVDAGRLDAGVAGARGRIDELAGRGRYTPDQANRLRGLITGSLDYAAFADADFVVEAVFEDLAVKREVFGRAEAVVSPTCVLATNTSGLSVTAMAEGLEHPERVVGFHFFNPVAVLPLVEVVRAGRTDEATVATALAVGAGLRKTCVLVADAPAFVVNRLLTRMFGEVTRAIDEGTDFAVADRALDPLGLPMSPLVLIQLVGPAIALHVAETLAGAFGDRFAVSPGLRALVDAGKGSFYRWDDGTPTVDPEVADLYGPRGGGPGAAEVCDRALAALADEARIMLDSGVVAEPADLDLAMILGAGWPFHLGGITPYLDRTGVSERVTGRRFAPPGIATLST